MDYSFIAKANRNPEAAEYWAETFAWRNKYLLPIAERLDKVAAIVAMIETGWYF